MGKFLSIVLIIIAIIFLSVSIFLIVYKPLGGLPNNNDKEDYAKRSEIFKDGKFVNPGEFTVMGKWNDPFKDRRGSKGVTPKDEIPTVQYKYTEPKEGEVLITWFGHSSSLIQIHGLNILVDPIFENITSPVSFIGPKRYSKVPVNIEELPEIDVILITHDHYDHVDYRTLRKLKDKTKKYLVPLGIDKDLIKFGLDKNKIQNMAWWEETNIDGVDIVCTPAQHFSGRFLLDSGVSLWSSWIIKDDNHTIFNSGDTGYSTHFKDISAKYDIDFAMLDGAQYNEQWHSVHMFPEESVDAAIDLKARVSMVEHNSAFVLSNHAWDDPINRFVMRAKEKDINYVTPKLGQTFNIDKYEDYQEEWWKDIN